VSETELDIARLQVLLAVQELNADTERLQIDRGATAVAVTGIVETESRKSEIANRLRMIPHVAADIHSYRDFDGKPGVSFTSNTVQAMSVVAGKSPLDDYCEARELSRDGCQQLAYRLLNSSAKLVRVDSRVADLQRLYTSAKPLTSRAQELLTELMHRYAFQITNALSDQQTAFETLGINRLREMDRKVSGKDTLTNAIQRNFNLTKELVYAKDEHSRTASLVIEDLAVSTVEVQAAMSTTPLGTIDRAATPQ
jgi:hypothetical protein